jgi:hypothetical protein
MTVQQILTANKAGLDGKFYMYRTPVLQAAFDLGADGVDLANAPVVTGYRYGKASDEFISYNYANGTKEPGLSLAAVEGEKEIGSAMWFADRQKYTYTGILSGKGSDGEPVILALDAECWD